MVSKNVKQSAGTETGVEASAVGSSNLVEKESSVAVVDPINGGFTENAVRVLHNLYLKKNDQGDVVETPVEMVRRVASHVAQVETDPERWTGQFFDMIWNRQFVPNSPTLMNAGRPLGMLSACFVLPLEDSIEDIMATARQIALVQRAGGGTGIDLSSLRPSGSIVKSSGGTTEGPLTFLRMLSSVTDAIQQGAFRRGANMGTMRIDHPDVLAFIQIKEDLTQVTNYNLSCTVPDDFMAQVTEHPNALHVVVNPHDDRNAYLRKDTNKADYEAYDSKESSGSDYWTVGDVYDLIVNKAWESGEPGLIFIDRINEYNQTPNLGDMAATNPCGEQPLLPYEACNLGSLNLSAFYQPAENGSESGSVDYESLGAVVRTAVRFLDDVVEVNNYPTAEIDEMCRANRKIGLGVMGWADLLFKMGIPYDSQEALDFAGEVGAYIRKEAWDEDSRLAEEKGVFDHWEGSWWDTVQNRKMRNAHTVTIAPTGTISIIGGCSGGIEPIFSLVFKRQVMRDVEGKAVEMYETNPVFLEALQQAGMSEEEINPVLEYVVSAGTLDGCPVDLPESVLALFRSARDVTPEWHVRMQGAWQDHTDAAVSKTINFASDATRGEVDEAYKLAFKLGCKGITVYRDGARAGQPMALDKKAEPAQNAGSASGQKDLEAIADLLMEG
ncbi:MAG: adenosylcobalamin-dependent ribonucleoside-diphosphate reductase [Planctomycetota bacterium]|nr:adenosylcobalamin-dependent ribonucleoside-diphosphate reductase [Planctomycetota bacterium]